MDVKANQENGVENLNGENGHADEEEAATHSDDASDGKGDGKGDEEKNKGADDDEEKNSDKPEGRTNFSTPRTHNNLKVFGCSSGNNL